MRRDPGLIGQVLAGTYRIERLLGKGGMGAVYAAAHTRLPARFAIKVLRATADAEGLARFRREAEITSRLRHPNIVQVFDFNCLRDGTPYLVMEHLEGEDLSARLRRDGRLALPETLHILRGVGAGLEAAHRHGVVHRDLKPSNIFLCRIDGGAEVPKIVDFGISKIRHAGDTDTTPDARLIGTPEYMAPEQARGQNSEIDARTDQWALAAIAYRCLRGRAPFAGDTVAVVLYQILYQEPPTLKELALPPHIAAAIARALSKEPGARFASVRDLLDALADEPARPSRGRTVALGLALAGLLAGGGYLGLRASGLPPRVATPAPPVSMPGPLREGPALPATAAPETAVARQAPAPKAEGAPKRSRPARRTHRRPPAPPPSEPVEWDNNMRGSQHAIR
jgi:serine/threonine-protein kinase